MRHVLLRTGLVALTAITLSGVAVAQEFDEKFDHWPVDHKINGTVIIAGSLSNPAQLSDSGLSRLLRRPGLRVTILVDTDADTKTTDAWRALFPEAQSTEDNAADDSDAENQAADTASAANSTVNLVKLGADPGAQLPSLLGSCDLFCWQSNIPLPKLAAETEVFTKLREPMMEHISAGGTVIACGPIATLLAQRYSVPGDTKTYQGLNILPDTVIDAAWDGSSRSRRKLLSVLAAHPRSVGIGLTQETALVLSGRKMRVVGEGTSTFVLMANDRQPLRMQTIARPRARQPGSRRQSAQEYLVDLTEWRRDAIDRTIEPFPPAEPRKPFVENGTLVIVGGGGMPRDLMSQFVDFAGGPEKAKLVYVPCAEQDEVSEVQRTVTAWKRMGVQHATFIHTKDRNRANSDDEFLKPLRDATGIWFGGGRQWNFADSYYGTQAHKLMKDVVRRGGVVGGSSAGASIQARYLARATPIENFRIMAPGYERGGLGFISGVAIDQHFSQRGRQKDMTQLVNRYPQMLGIGLDEATAIIVRKSVAEVVGRGKAHFYDRQLPVYPDRPDYVALPAGSAYDLADRKILIDTNKSADAESETRSDK